MSTGRNDACPCGSGRKFKRCCGAGNAGRAAAAPAPGGAATATVGGGTAPARTCGPCTACCDGWVAGTIRGYEMKRGVPCHFRGEGCCTIYEERPVSPCRTFVCGWLAPGSPFPDAFRPDLLGVIVVPIRWRGGPAFVLVNAGRDPDDALLQWMQALSVRIRAPFFYERGGEKFGFGPHAFQIEMLAKAERGEPMW